MKMNLKRVLGGLSLTLIAMSLQSCFVGVSSAHSVYQQRAIHHRPHGLIATSSSFWFYDPWRHSYFDTRSNRYFNHHRNTYYSVAPRRFNRAVYPHSWRPNRGIALPAPRFNNNRNLRQANHQPYHHNNQYQRRGINRISNGNQRFENNRSNQNNRGSFGDLVRRAQSGERIDRSNVNRQNSQQVRSSRRDSSFRADRQQSRNSSFRNSRNSRNNVQRVGRDSSRNRSSR